MKTRLWLAIAVVVVVVGGIAVGLRPSDKADGLNEGNAASAPRLPPAAKPERILVIGGTSGIGLAVAQLAASRGHQVTVMARHRPANLSSAVRFIAGDVLSPASVATAVRDQDAVVTSIGVSPSRRPMTVFSRGMANLLQAMASSGPSRLIAVTGIGAGDSRGHGGYGYDHVFLPLLMRGMYDDKTREEAAIRASGLEWTIVRPGFLNNGPASGRYRVVENLAGVTSGTISRADVAHFIVAALEQPRYRRDTVLLTD